MTFPLPFPVPSTFDEVYEDFRALSLAWPITGTRLWGRIDGATGAITLAGSGGWTSARTAAGTYVITFNTAFAAASYIINITTYSAPVVVIPYVDNTLVGSCQFRMFNLAGAAVDGSAMFVITARVP